MVLAPQQAGDPGWRHVQARVEHPVDHGRVAREAQSTSERALELGPAEVRPVRRPDDVRQGTPPVAE
eukprot:4369207-Pyramimonas_sp.AAC.1